MGTRLIIGSLRATRWEPSNFVLDVKQDRKGSFFEILARSDMDLELNVLQTRPRDRHLLMMIREPNTSERATGGTIAHRFLCGHDERDWFAAAVTNASTVTEALEALKPPAVRRSQMLNRVKAKRRNKRRNAAFVRQGEWFFVPAPRIDPNPRLVLTKEPLRRGRGRPHVAEFAFRQGGTPVYVSNEHPNGISEAAYRRLIQRSPDKQRMSWRVMLRDPIVYVKGKVRHPDHKTVKLTCWHRVAPNTETRAPSMRNLAFLD